MRRKVLFVLVVLLSVLCLTGCNFKKEKVDEPTLVEQVVITSEEYETLGKISNLVFNVEKEELKVSDLTEEEKSEIARDLTEGRYTEISGKEMTKKFQQYFGEDQTVKYTDMNCFMKHNKEEEQVLYYFDQEKDKYVYNEQHPGHGGGGVAFIGNEMTFDQLGIVDKEYHYSVKVLFYGEAMCHDIGPCDYGKAYKSYTDAKNGTNPLTEIDNNTKYTTTDYMSGLPEVHLDKVIEDYKEELNTYEFVFVKEKGNLIFKEYFIQK